jgi:hypothetical protein
MISVLPKLLRTSRSDKAKVLIVTLRCLQLAA